MIRQRFVSFLICSTGLLAAGCGIEPETLQALNQAVHAASGQEASGAPAMARASAVDTGFVPPYPERIDPFSFPDTAPIADTETTSTATMAQVGVLGFAYTDEPRVFLKTRESTKSLKVGDITDGVEVVAIHPPTVDLKMGTLVWTATMFGD